MKISIQAGFSLVSAIFLLVVIAALGAFAVALSTTQQQSVALDVMGSRAYQAARAGVDWAAYQVVNNSAPALAAPCSSANLGALSGVLAPFAVTVNWCAVSHPDGIWLYDVSSVATTGGAPGDPGYVERAISAKLGK